MTDTDISPTGVDDLRAQAEEIADQVASAIARADQRGVTEDYLDGAHNTLAQALMAVDYRLGPEEAQRILLRRVLRALVKSNIPIREGWSALACEVFDGDKEIYALLRPTRPTAP